MKMFDVIRWLEGLKVSLGGPGKWLHNHPAHGKREMGFTEMSDKHLENTIAMLERLEDAIFVAWNAIQDKRYGLELHMKRRREKRQRAEEPQRIRWSTTQDPKSWSEPEPQIKDHQHRRDGRVLASWIRSRGF